jgi:hypothetical protein
VRSVFIIVNVSMQVQPGDVLLAGSDGLWDNCYESELLQLLPDRAEGAAQVCPCPRTLLDRLRGVLTAGRQH